MQNPGKRRRGFEDYEKYWKVTLAFTDIDSKKFIGTLRIIKNFIDENNAHLQGAYSPELYKELQVKVNDFNPMFPTSIRKSINQFVKLGFVNSGGRGYHSDLEDFLNAKTDRRRQTIFSKIVYENSSFLSSWKTELSVKGHIEFLIKTLEQTKKLCKEDILGLMLVNINEYEKGFLNRTELDEFVDKTEDSNFLDRKYNQLSHFRSILKRLDGLRFETYYPHGECLLFEDYADDEFKDRWKHEGRDPYLQNRYRALLIDEAFENLNKVACMVSGVQCSLIASHIKPFSSPSTTKEEAYDQNNGLLLSIEIDKFFDKGKISFNDNGTIILSKRLPENEKNSLEKLHIPDVFLNRRRLEYMNFHRKEIFK